MMLFSGRSRWLWWALIVLIFAVGLGVRLYRLGDPPVDFHPTRQLHSALIARGMFYQDNARQKARIPDWQRKMAVDQWHMEGVIEPQVFERLAAWTYGLVGTDDLRAPRLYAILFWMIAAGFLTALSADLTGLAGALVAELFFLTWPYGVIASRAFQPEPLMIALMAAGLWCAFRWERAQGARPQRVDHVRGSWGWAISAGLLCGLAIYIKSVAVFFLAPALTVLVLSGCDLRQGFVRSISRSLRDPQLWALGCLAVLPSTLYYIDGVAIHGFLVGQFSNRFFPEMWRDPAFYLRWLSNLGRALPPEMVLVAVAGAFLVRRPAYRAALLAMWAGYVLYGMALPHLISTHDYYHLPLFPLVALGLGAAAETIFQAVRGSRWLARLAVTGLLVAALAIEGYSARTALKRSGAVEQANAWAAVGQALGPGASAIALVDDYGTGLKYWGWINPALWPTADDIQWQESLGQGFDFNAFFENQAAGKDFFVAMPAELDNQPRLKDLLAAKYTLLRQGPGYLLYDLRSPKSGLAIP